MTQSNYISERLFKSIYLFVLARSKVFSSLDMSTKPDIYMVLYGSQPKASVFYNAKCNTCFSQRCLSIQSYYPTHTRAHTSNFVICDMHLLSPKVLTGEFHNLPNAIQLSHSKGMQHSRWHLHALVLPLKAQGECMMFYYKACTESSVEKTQFYCTCSILSRAELFLCIEQRISGK